MKLPRFLAGLAAASLSALFLPACSGAPTETSEESAQGLVESHVAAPNPEPQGGGCPGGCGFTAPTLVPVPVPVIPDNGGCINGCPRVEPHPDNGGCLSGGCENEHGERNPAPGLGARSAPTQPDGTPHNGCSGPCDHT